MSATDQNDDDMNGPVKVAEYVLGVLDATEHEDVARRIADDPSLQAEARFWQTKLSQLDAQFEPVAPPSGSFAAIERRLFGTAQPTRGIAGLWSNLTMWRALAGGALAVAVVAVGFAVIGPTTTGDPSSSPDRLVANLQSADTDVTFVALYSAASGTLRLSGLSGQKVPDKDYELWFIEEGTDPISMGLIPVDGKSEVVLTDHMRDTIAEGTTFAVTLEPLGGASEGKATGPIVASGKATLI